MRNVKTMRLYVNIRHRPVRASRRGANGAIARLVQRRDASGRRLMGAGKALYRLAPAKRA